MHERRPVFAQLMDFFPKREFDECVKRYRGNYRVRDFSCRDQFLAMAFAQLTYRESLRDIETCLNAVPSRLYHAGFRGRVSKSTLSDANKRRDWRIYTVFFLVSRSSSNWPVFGRFPSHIAFRNQSGCTQDWISPRSGCR